METHPEERRDSCLDESSPSEPSGSRTESSPCCAQPEPCCEDERQERSSAAAREPFVRQGLRLEYLTLGWEVIEAAVALIAAAMSGSVALLGFGIDSVAELASATILIWRLKSEQHGRSSADIETIDRRARRMVGASLFVLAGYIAFDAIQTLIFTAKPAGSVTGIAVTSVAMAVMWWLGRAKRRVATPLKSGALFSDAFQATACFWLCLITLAGLALNMALGWWWADPAAALVMVYFIAREGLEAWRGNECSC